MYLSLAINELMNQSHEFYDPENPLHVSVFNMTWIPAFKEALASFVDMHNHHKVRKQKIKKMPSRGCPQTLYVDPERFGGIEMGVSIPQATLETIREERRSAAPNSSDFQVPLEHYTLIQPILAAHDHITIQNAWDAIRYCLNELDTRS